jgi:hypothetical protein
MLAKFLKFFEKKYLLSKSDYLSDMMIKTRKILEYKKKHNSLKKDQVVHIISNSFYNHELIKRVDSFLEDKSSLDCEHHFFLIGTQKNFLKEDSYIHKIYCVNDLSDPFFNQMILNADLILIQYLFPFIMNYFNHLNYPIKGIIAWMPWGGDYIGYHQKFFFDSFDIEYCKQKKFNIDNDLRVWNYEYKQAFDIFMQKVSIIFSNMDIFRELSINRPHLIHINYVFPQEFNEISTSSSIENQSQYFSEYSNMISQKKDHIKIVLGNSSSPENNHFSALLHLKKLEKKSKNHFLITTILSYGDLNTYKSMVEEYGKELFGENFISFSHFLNPSEFRSFIMLQDLAYMNHIRPQGFGAINLYLMHEVPIFLRYDNPTNRVLRDFELETGCNLTGVYTIDTLATYIENFVYQPKTISTEWPLNKAIIVKVFEESKETFKYFFS